MEIQLVIGILILKKVTSQYNYQQYDQNQQYYQMQEPDDYEEEERSDYRRQCSHVQNTNDYENQMASEDCKCSCSDCDNPQACCIDMCYSQCAPEGTNSYMQPQQSPPAQSSLVLVPYPVPLVLPSLAALGGGNTTKADTSTATTTTPTTTTAPHPTTTSEKTTEQVHTTTMAEEIDTSEIDKIPEKLARANRASARNKHGADLIYTRLSPRKRDYLQNAVPSLRRTRPTWVPKYRIVPIPDKLAEKLMSQLRDVRDMKPFHRDRYRRMLVETIDPK